MIESFIIIVGYSLFNFQTRSLEIFDCVQMNEGLMELLLLNYSTWKHFTGCKQKRLMLNRIISVRKQF